MMALLGLTTFIILVTPYFMDYNEYDEKEEKGSG
jgi:hypothetical protein